MLDIFFGMNQMLIRKQFAALEAFRSNSQFMAKIIRLGTVWC